MYLYTIKFVLKLTEKEAFHKHGDFDTVLGFEFSCSLSFTCYLLVHLSDARFLSPPRLRIGSGIKRVFGGKKRVPGQGTFLNKR